MFGNRPKAPRQTSRNGGLPDLYSFNCLTCDEWHMEEGNAAPSNQKQSAGAAG